MGQSYVSLASDYLWKVSGRKYSRRQAICEFLWFPSWQIKVERRKKSYLITVTGEKMLEKEYHRLYVLRNDYESLVKGDTE